MGDIEDFHITPVEAETLHYIASNLENAYPRKIAESFSIEDSAASKRLKGLKEKKLVEKSGPPSTQQFYEPTKKGWKTLVQWLQSQSQSSSFQLRAHKIAVKFPVVEGQEAIKEAGDVEREIELRNTEQLESFASHPLYKKVRYRLTSRSLLVYPPEQVYPPTEKGVWLAGREAVDIASYVKNELRSDFPDLKFSRAEPDFADRHYAFERHPLALAMKELGEKGVVSEGGLWKLYVDESEGHPELEVEGERAVEFAENLADNIEFLARYDLSELLRDMDSGRERLEEKIGRLKEEIAKKERLQELKRKKDRLPKLQDRKEEMEASRDEDEIREEVREMYRDKGHDLDNSKIEARIEDMVQRELEKEKEKREEIEDIDQEISEIKSEIKGSELDIDG